MLIANYNKYLQQCYCGRFIIILQTSEIIIYLLLNSCTNYQLTLNSQSQRNMNETVLIETKYIGEWMIFYIPNELSLFRGYGTLVRLDERGWELSSIFNEDTTNRYFFAEIFYWSDLKDNFLVGIQFIENKYLYRFEILIKATRQILEWEKQINFGIRWGERRKFYADLLS